MQKEYITNNIDEFKQVVRDFVDDFVFCPKPSLGQEPMRRACPPMRRIGLIGDLGAGKTTFVQEVAKILGVKEVVTSPTFTIMKKYEISASSADKPVLPFPKTLIHIDAYRLDGVESASALRLDEVFADPENIVFIEWPENIKEALPKEYVRIEISHEGGEKRKIKFLIPNI